jgi:hypothetical protein
VPDYRGDHIVENVNNSCDTTSGFCNPLRFYPYATNYYENAFGGGGVLGLGDITGDGFGDIAVAAASTWIFPNKMYIYSGGNSGLQVASTPSTQPQCLNGTCAPYTFTMPNNASYTQWPNSIYNPSWEIFGYSGAADIDHDGTPDFLINSPYMNDPAGNGYMTGGYFLFH